MLLNTPAKKVNFNASLENINTEGNKENNKEPTVTDQVLFAENNGSNILANALLEAELTYLDGLDESVISNFDNEVLLSSTTLETGVWSFVLFNDAWSQKGHSASNTTVILA